MKGPARQFLPSIPRGGGPRKARWRGHFGAGLGTPLHHPASPAGPPALQKQGRNGFESSWRSAEHGFTLVELMVVILIIGLLATVVIINVLPATDKAAETKAKADVSTLETAAEMYRLNKLVYPSAAEGLQALAREGYVKRLPKDPWGNPYHYAAPGRDGRPFDISSYGADGREGGEGKDADIGNWDGS
jgi:general secretion pathway protein G